MGDINLTKDTNKEPNEQVNLNKESDLSFNNTQYNNANNYYQNNTNYDNIYGQAGQNFQQTQNNVYGQQNSQQAQNSNAPEYMVILILSVIQILTICCCTPLTCIMGIISLASIIGANSEFKDGNYIAYQSKSKTAKITNITGWVLFGISLIIHIIAFIVYALNS